MTFLFVLICLALVALAVVWLVRPLRASVSGGHGTEHDRLNLNILRTQREELEREHLAGALDASAYQDALAELQKRVLEELPATVPARALHTGARAAALSIALVLPVAATALYLMLGNRDAFDREVVRAKPVAQLVQQLQSGDAAGVIEQARAQLKHQPDNSELWFVLARAHYEHRQFAEAAAAYEKLNALEPNDAALLTDWADALAQAQNRSMQGKPEELVKQALAIEPGHGKALAMAGAAAFERHDYAGAVAHWEKLRALVAGTELAPQIEQSIAQARQAGGMPASAGVNSAAITGKAITGQVLLGKTLQNAVAPTDTVFIVAREVSGPPMPVAVLRVPSKDWPLSFRLDDTLALNPERKLSTLTEVMLSARVSKSGNAMPQPGDVESAPQKVRLGANNVKLVLDQVRPQ